MSVSLSPSSSLGFNRPLTEMVKRSLTITNHNAQAVTFKVKTTAPKLYCVRPNSGKVEPGESVQVSVMLQPMKEDPPLAAKCKDKFLIQSTLITKEKENMSLADMWSSTDSEETKVHQQKLRVMYLPASGQTLQEEDEGAVANMSSMTVGDSQFETIRTNGRTVDPIPEFHDEHEDSQRDLSQSRDLGRPATPTGDFSVAQEDSHEDQQPSVNSSAINNAPPPMVLPQHPAPISVPAPPTPTRELEPERIVPVSAPAPVTAPVYVTPEQPQVDFEKKYQDAEAEIVRLQRLLTETATAAAAVPELRKRSRTLADDEVTVAGTDIQSDSFQTEGVPLQVVVIIAFSVFCVTYLFF